MEISNSFSISSPSFSLENIDNYNLKLEIGNQQFLIGVFDQNKIVHLEEYAVSADRNELFGRK
jgi:hypothetical protein